MAAMVNNKLSVTVNFFEDLWGPKLTPETKSSCLGRIKNYPFELSLKPEKLISVCEFAHSMTHKSSKNDPRSASTEQALEFHLVDSRPFPKTKTRYPQRRFQKQITQAYQQKQQEQADQMGKNRKGQKMKQNQSNRYQRYGLRMRTFNEWSVEPTSQWENISEISINSLTKQYLDISRLKIDDVCWSGEIYQYNKLMDRISPKLPVAVEDYGNREFYSITASDDDTIRQIIVDEAQNVQVAITNQVLACLMGAVQGKYSWHILVANIEGKLIFDKQDGSILDLLTVNETSPDPPLQDDPNRSNRPHVLGLEALKINHNVSQQLILKDQDKVKTNGKPSFYEHGVLPASRGYRYRIITLPGRDSSQNEQERKPIRLVTRAEVDAYVVDAKGDVNYVAIHALNEYDAKSIKTWKNQLETQKGALLATEIRNNTCKLTRWVAQALVADCDYLKLGYVTRATPADKDNHQIVSVQSYKTKDFSGQIGLRLENAWGIVRSLIDLLISQPEGQYVLLKDPMKPILRIYRIKSTEGGNGSVGEIDLQNVKMETTV